MKTIISLLVLITFCKNIQSQSFALKNNQEKIEFQKLNFKQDSLKLTISKNRKISINYNDIKGYYSVSKNTFYHKKTAFIEGAFKGDIMLHKKDAFLERVSEGEIKLYKKIITMHNGNMTNDVTFWFAEKGNIFINLYIREGFFQTKSKEKINTIKSMLSNDSISTSILENHNFKYKLQELIKIIKDYNLRQHKNKESKNSIKSKVVFFRDNRSQNKATVNFTIGDKKYYLDKNEKIEIDLPVNENILVCINNESINVCELINPSSNFKKCYEIDFRKNKKGFIVKKNSNSSYLKARFKYFDKKGKKK